MPVSFGVAQGSAFYYPCYEWPATHYSDVSVSYTDDPFPS